MTFGTLDRPHDGDHPGLGPKAKLATNRGRIRNPVQAEVGEIDRVVDPIDTAWKTGRHRVGDGHDALSVPQHESGVPRAQCWAGAEHLAHHPRHALMLAARGSRPRQEHAGVEVKQVWPLLVQYFSRTRHRTWKGSDKPRDRAWP